MHTYAHICWSKPSFPKSFGVSNIRKSGFQSKSASDQKDLKLGLKKTYGGKLVRNFGAVMVISSGVRGRTHECARFSGSRSKDSRRE